MSVCHRAARKQLQLRGAAWTGGLLANRFDSKSNHPIENVQLFYVTQQWFYSEIFNTRGNKSRFCFKAKESIREMKKELDALLQTAEKAFTVELLKIPLAIRKMKRKDLLSKYASILCLLLHTIGICEQISHQNFCVCPWLMWEKAASWGTFMKKVSLPAEYFKLISSGVTLQVTSQYSHSGRLIYVTQGVELVGNRLVWSCLFLVLLSHLT